MVATLLSIEQIARCLVIYHHIFLGGDFFRIGSRVRLHCASPLTYRQARSKDAWNGTLIAVANAIPRVVERRRYEHRQYRASIRPISRIDCRVRRS